MNKIILDHYPASKLPRELREGISPTASVRVTIEEEIRNPLSAEELRRQFLNVRSNLKHKVTLEEAAARVRELRDEWDN